MSRTAALLMCMITSGLAALGAFSAGYSLGDQTDKSRVYELRTYTALPGRGPAMHARFRNHTLKMFEKHGMQNGLYWVPTDEKLKDDTLIYFLVHESPEAAKKSWDAFMNDAEWKQIAADSEKDGKILAKRPESVYMTLTDYSPKGK
ncbi:MAG: NIPSNAP family protein [Planctomycetaceae bacterium]